MSFTQVVDLLKNGWPTLELSENQQWEGQYQFFIMSDRLEELIAKYTGVNPEYEGKDISQNP